ncbi:MAG: carbohydrate porin [Pseudomonadota bacterium]|nr:carbohydrate porin [Pseudomonadota bacterium]
MTTAMMIVVASSQTAFAQAVPSSDSGSSAAQGTKGAMAAKTPPTPDTATPATPATNQAPPPPPSFTSSGPFSFSAAVTADMLADVAGGISQGVKLLTKTNLAASYDGSAGNGSGFLGPGWTGQASLQYVKGGHISAANVGDVQGLDSIEAFNALRLYELWLQRQWAGGKYGVKFGFTDLNVDFDTQQVAALFLNSSDGVGAEFGHSGLNGPSIYPTTALGLSGYFKPGDPWTLRAGVLNGLAGSDTHPSDFVAVHISARTGALLVVQAEHVGASGLRTYIGGWAYTADFDALHLVDAKGNPLRRARMRGAYGLVEGQIGGSSGGRSLSGWVRAGLGDPVVERISGYIGGGLVVTGLFKRRSEDQAGISINHAIVDQPGLPPGAFPAKRAETAIELTYRVQAKDWLSVQPDLQYIHRPNGDPTIPSALVVGMRLSVSLTKNLVDKIKGGP